VASSGNESNKREKNDSKLARVLNSAMAFMIAYLLVMGFLYMSAAVMGKLFGFDVQVYYYTVKFQLGRQGWTSFNTSWIYGVSTLILAGVGMVSLYAYHYFKAKLQLANLVLLWAAVISFSIAAAQGLLPVLATDVSSPYYTNLAIVYDRWHMPDSGMYFILILFFAGLIFFAINLVRPFLYFSYSYSKVNKRNRRLKYFVETAILPFVIASALILIFYWQTYHQINFMLQNGVYIAVISGVLLVTFLMVNIIDVRPDDVLRYKNLQQISAVQFVVLIVVLVILTVTWQGIYFPF